ncbi:hypothetical protein [Thiopseudomonas denitrificans]|uniref:DnrO protein n=1 Tax=Thiopseudomonas denitrificans TaxID=1501432 RepID=A0A4R6U0P8_9GAMM|nr:hypothetical protein [Thiopseudomonas denitrificans]TDQ38183.1 hypothetical protein DFQ45_10594 [Thiopseudomonas denitrificans]
MTIKSNLFKCVAVTGLALSLGSVSAFTMAAEEEHDHGQAITEMQLNNGSKWGIDAPLSQAMAKISQAINAEVESIHADTLAQENYVALASEINTQVAYMIENCELEPAADAQLHIIIHDLMDGSASMENQSSARNGAVKVINALGNYANYFDDPKFQPVAH